MIFEGLGEETKEIRNTHKHEKIFGTARAHQDCDGVGNQDVIMSVNFAS